MTYTRVMIGSFDLNGRSIRVDFSLGRSLAIPLDPHGQQPSFYAADRATAEPLRSGTYVGSVSAGGSCNAEIISHAPHCHGTHTECIGHILPSADPVQKTIDSRPGLSRLISVHGTDPAESHENYSSSLEPGERLICAEEIREQMRGDSIDNYSALIIRTLPNDATKSSRDYSANPHYPVLSQAAIQWLAASNLRHLLVDMPSLDKADDGGRLANHRSWWGINVNESADPARATRRSVTEMVFVADDIEDGEYWFELQLSPLVSDACSSRPIIYPLVAT